jgi:O-antigen ligase
MTPPRQGWERLRWALWVMLLVSIPVTSFPYFPFPRAFVEALVRPLGLYPLGGLILLEVLVPNPAGRKLPRVLAPILAFAAVAIASTALALLDPALPLRDQVPLSRALRGLITLAIGLAFLLATLRLATSWERILASVRWLLVGLSISVAWGLLQGSRLLFRWPYYAPLNAVQRLFSTWDLSETRVTGLSYEPSWFADQLAVLFFPLLLASLLTGAHILLRRKGGWLLEVALLSTGLIGLALSYSRGGALTFAVSISLGLVVGLAVRRSEVVGWFRKLTRRGAGERTNRWTFVSRVTLGLLAAAAIIVVAIGLISRDLYFSQLWESLGKLGDLPAYILALGASTRYALAAAAWKVFGEHPLLGVGLGQSGFYLFDHLPDWALDRNPEMAFMLMPSSWTFPNPKNLWVRLLAETGLAGSLFFVVFLVLLAAGSLTLMSRRSLPPRLIGLFGVIALPAVLLSGTSLDSFALPTMWIALGLIASGIEVLKTENERGPDETPLRLADTIPPNPGMPAL